MSHVTNAMDASTYSAVVEYESELKGQHVGPNDRLKAIAQKFPEIAAAVMSGSVGPANRTLTPTRT